MAASVSKTDGMELIKISLAFDRIIPKAAKAINRVTRRPLNAPARPEPKTPARQCWRLVARPEKRYRANQPTLT